MEINMNIQQNMSLMEKLSILTAAAKYRNVRNIKQHGQINDPIRINIMVYHRDTFH